MKAKPQASLMGVQRVEKLIQEVHEATALGERLIAASQEALSIAKGEAKPAAALGGIFGKKVDTVIVDEVAPVAELTGDADAIPDAPAEEAAKPAVKSIFSKAS